LIHDKKPDMPLTLALVDDHEMFRSGIKLILSQKEEWKIGIEAGNGADFLAKMELIRPDVVLMDIAMPGLDGCETAKKALKRQPDLKIIALSMHNDQEYYYKMIEAGAMGFVLKNSGVGELFHAIEAVAEGNNYFAQDLLKQIVLRINHGSAEEKLQLNAREKSVLYYICNGYTNREIAEALYLSVKSIEKYRSSLLHKTQTRNSAHLVMHAIQNHIIDLSGKNASKI